MCGIAGIYQTSGPASFRDTLSQMLAAITHRGPDGDGLWIDPQGMGGLGHKRLAIIDPDGGHQPLANEDETVWVVFNGCIYNYQDIARLLRQRGHVFRTHSDTEVIVHAYEEWGSECVTRFNGMWAFAIWDSMHRTLFCSRDRVGVKPFYYTWDGKSFTFASEIKALLASHAVVAEPNPTGLRHYLTFQFCLGETTLFRRIKKLLPGHNLLLKPGQAPIVSCYWDMQFNIDDRHDESYFEDQLEWLLEDAVRLRLREIGHWIKILADPTTYPTALNGAQPGGVHPVFATTTVNSLLLHTLQTEGKEAEKQAIRQAVQHFFENYVFSTKTPRADQSVSWPYHFPWTMNWGIRLSPPWYSAYTNGVVTQTAALLYALTGEQRYQVLALEAAQYLNTSISKGGAEYEVAGFHLPAEYVYNTPPLPNVRVLDGEFITITALYNGARLLGDSQLLHIFMRQAFSLAMQLAYYVQPDGNLYFSTYIEEMPMHYKWVLWSNLQALANITKDRRFFDVAKVLRPHIPDFWCQSNGC